MLAGELPDKVLDGSCIDATERRIGVFRKEAAAPLPGKALAAPGPRGTNHRLFPLCGWARPGPDAVGMLGRVFSRVDPGGAVDWGPQLCNAGVSIRNCRAGGVFSDPGARKSAVGGGRSGRIGGTRRERLARASMVLHGAALMVNLRRLSRYREQRRRAPLPRKRRCFGVFVGPLGSVAQNSKVEKKSGASRVQVRLISNSRPQSMLDSEIDRIFSEAFFGPLDPTSHVPLGPRRARLGRGGPTCQPPF